jgi:DNA-binding PadR family transcriptional regulator
VSLREAILGLLDDGPMTGYQMKQFFRYVIRHFWSVSDGQLYPTLKKMHEDGLISLKVVEQKGTANKHVFSITEKGQERFARWLREPVTKFEELKEPFVLKVFFFGKLSPEEIRSHLRTQLELHERILEELQEVRETYEDNVGPYQQLIGYAGILYVEVRILWLARMIELLDEGGIEADPGLYTGDMVELGKRFFEEVFSEAPSKEFRAWLAKKKLPPRLTSRGHRGRPRTAGEKERSLRSRPGRVGTNDRRAGGRNAQGRA